MSQPYSQSRALWAITRASFKAIFGNPSAIIFSILFPIIFVLIFGAFGSGGGVTYRLALDKGCDTTNVLYQSLKNNPSIQIISYSDEDGADQG
jgi:ABC-2 type transport system permease protein